MTTLYQSVPQGWEKTSLRRLVERPKNGAWGAEEGEDEFDAVCVRVADFDWSRLALNLNNPTRRSFKKKQFQTLQLMNGDILLEKSGGGEKTPVGRVVAFEGNVDSLTSNFVARVRPLEIYSSRYCLYILAAHYLSGFSHQFIKQNTGIQNLDDANLFRSDVWVPDLPTQRAIADFLDRETARIDLLIEKREEFAALVASARDSLIASLICGQSARVQTHPSADWTENRPAHWKIERTKMHFKERVQKSIGGEEELLSVSHITGVTPRSEKDVNMFLAETNDGYKIVNIGDIVINTMWGWMGAMGVSKTSGIASPAYGVYRAISNAFDPHFLDLLLRSKPFIGEVTRRSKGIHSSRLRIYPDAFLDIRLPIPPRDEQEVILAQIRTRTERENRLVEKNEYATSLLKEYRSSLITAAVTGQIDVTKWVKAGTADRKLDAIQATMNA